MELNKTLIDRLRGRYQVGPDGDYGTRSFADFIPPISLEAADAIQSLEAQNTAYRTALESIAEKAPVEIPLRELSEHRRRLANKALVAKEVV